MVDGEKLYQEFYPKVLGYVRSKVSPSEAEDVTAKAEIVPKTVEEVPFVPAVPDGTGLDESHILGERDGK